MTEQSWIATGTKGTGPLCATPHAAAVAYFTQYPRVRSISLQAVTPTDGKGFTCNLSDMLRGAKFPDGSPKNYNDLSKSQALDPATYAKVAA